MKYTSVKVGLWLLNEDTNSPIKLTEELVINILKHKTLGNLKPIKLNTNWLINFEFIEERKRRNDVDGIWIKHGVTIYESAWDGDFNYGTYVKSDGEFKGGFAIKYVHQLQLLFDGFTDGIMELNIEQTQLY